MYTYLFHLVVQHWSFILQLTEYSLPQASLPGVQEMLCGAFLKGSFSANPNDEASFLSANRSSWVLNTGPVKWGQNFKRLSRVDLQLLCSGGGKNEKSTCMSVWAHLAHPSCAFSSNAALTKHPTEKPWPPVQPALFPNSTSSCSTERHCVYSQWKQAKCHLSANQQGQTHSSGGSVSSLKVKALSSLQLVAYLLMWRDTVWSQWQTLFKFRCSNNTDKFKPSEVTKIWSSTWNNGSCVLFIHCIICIIHKRTSVL